MDQDTAISKYCGVVVKGNRIWTQFKGSIINYHDTEEEAAKQYDAMALEEYGIFAYLNFPEEPQ